MQRPEAWLSGTVSFRLSSLSPDQAQELRDKLMLYRQGFDSSGMVSFCLEHGDWMHVPRGWYVTQAGSIPWMRGVTIHEGRVPGHALPHGARANAQFGVSRPGLKIPPGQPQFIANLVAGCQHTGIGGMGQAPTRSGKTLCALEAACRLGSSTLILVNQDVLAGQWHRAVEGDPEKPHKPHLVDGHGRALRCGVIQGRRFDMPPAYPFVVAMVQTLMRRKLSPEQRAAFGTVIVDEADSAPCESVYGALRRLAARHVIGLSATPDRADGLGEAITWVIGPRIANLDRELEADVFFRRRRWRKVKIPSADGKLRSPRVTRMGTVNSVEVEKSLMRDEEHVLQVAMDAEWGVRQGEQVLIFVGMRPHARILSDACKARGLKPSIFMGGQTSSSNLCGNPVVATYQAAAKGTDIEPAPTLCILAAPRSDVRQAMGRALQPSAPRRPKILDYVYDHPSLVKQARRRARTYRQKRLVLLNGVDG